MNGKEKKELRKNICDRFQDVASLRKWVEVNFGDEIHSISWDRLDYAAFELIQRASGRGWLETLTQKLDDSY